LSLFYGLQIIGDLYGAYKNTLSRIVREFCGVVRKHLQHVFVQIPSELHFRILTSRFEQLHGIHYIIGTIDELHNHVLAPIIVIIVRIFSFNNFTGNWWIKLYVMEL
jgi:hypothetical protein